MAAGAVTRTERRVLISAVRLLRSVPSAQQRFSRDLGVGVRVSFRRSLDRVTLDK